MLVQPEESMLVGFNKNSTIHSWGRIGRVVKRLFFVKLSWSSILKIRVQCLHVLRMILFNQWQSTFLFPCHFAAELRAWPPVGCLENCWLSLSMWSRLSFQGQEENRCRLRSQWISCCFLLLLIPDNCFCEVLRIGVKNLELLHPGGVHLGEHLNNACHPNQVGGTTSQWEGYQRNRCAK